LLAEAVEAKVPDLAAQRIVRHESAGARGHERIDLYQSAGRVWAIARPLRVIRRRIHFTPAILPRYLRRLKSIEMLLPILHVTKNRR